MLTLYLIALVVGGVLVGTSMLLGGKDVGGGHDHDLGHGHDVAHAFEGGHGHDVHHEIDAHGEPHAPAHSMGTAIAAWLPFLSLRFWTFFAAFFGLTGVVLTALSIAWLPALLASLGVGVVCGVMVSVLVQKVRMAQTDSSVQETDLEGTIAKVLLPISPDAPGKIRVNIKGSSIDMQAVTHDAGVVPRGAEVLVVKVGRGEAVVTKVAPPAEAAQSTRARTQAATEHDVN